MGHRLPDAAHTSRPWRIHEVAAGFRLENVWAIQVPGTSGGDFSTVLDTLFPLEGAAAPFAGAPAPLRLLLAMRRNLGRLLRWDPPQPRDGGRGLLRDQLPDDLRGAAANAPRSFASMTALCEFDDECAFEFVNNTVHGVMHLGWLPAEDRTNGGYELRMAELTQPNGRLGRLYLAAIAPFRRSLAVPALLRQWEARLGAPQSTREHR